MQKIIVKNFRQISSAEVEIKNILFLIGEQASGKSTLAKLIYFFKSLKEDYYDLINENANKTDNNLQTLFIRQIQNKFKVYFGYTTELDDDFEILFYYHFVSNDSTQNRYLKLSKTNFLRVEFESDYFGEIIKNTRALAKEINESIGSKVKPDENSYIVIERTKRRLINNLTEKINKLFYDDFTPMFFPAGRNITVSYPEQFQTLFFGNLYNSSTANESPANSADMLLMKAFILYSKFLNDYFRSNNFESMISDKESNDISVEAFKFFKSHSEYILKGKYDNSDGNEKIVCDAKINKSVSINLASSGQQESIRIIQDLFYLLDRNQKSFRIIEEPEAHLYPKAQKKIIELLALVTNKTNSQIIITTHSPYILSILNNLLMYSEVIKNKPNTKNIIEEHFGTTKLNKSANERINLLSTEVQVYALSPNSEIYCHSVIDKETGLIGENYLDTITEELNNDFEVLYSLNFSNK